jgi:hypothetical protein
MFSNAAMSPRIDSPYCCMDAGSEVHDRARDEPVALSARAYDRILKVSRTIADLANPAEIKSDHVSEAIPFARIGLIGLDASDSQARTRCQAAFSSSSARASDCLQQLRVKQLEAFRCLVQIFDPSANGPCRISRACILNPKERAQSTLGK